MSALGSVNLASGFCVIYWIAVRTEGGNFDTYERLSLKSSHQNCVLNMYIPKIYCSVIL